MNIHIYVEGGGDRDKEKTACREGYSTLFQKVVKAGKQPKIIVCGSRQQAYKRFCTALDQNRNNVCILLIDSEAPVTAKRVWEHLKNRPGNGWQRPSTATEEQVYLMVQSMESWFLADREALEKFYGQGFNPKALPRQPNIEQIPKKDVFEALKAATRQSKTKGEYHKTKHGFALLEWLDPKKVGRASPQAKRLFLFLNRDFAC